MSVTSVGERKGRRSTTEADDGTRSHSRVYYVRTDSDTDHGNTVLASSLLPQKGEAHPTDLLALVNGRTPNEIEKGHWEVDIQYGPRDPQDTDDTERDPTSRESFIRVSFQSMLVPVTADADPAVEFDYMLGAGGVIKLRGGDGSNAVVNAAGEPFDPPVMRRQSFPVLEITEFETVFDAKKAQKFIDSVNVDQITIAGFEIPPRSAFMMGISTPGIRWETIDDIEFFYFPIVYTIHLNMETFDLLLLEHGTYFIDASDGNKLKAFLTDEGQPRLGLLTEDGDDNTGEKPVYKLMSNYRQEVWGTLALPKSMLPARAANQFGGAKQGEKP